jgi:N-carbamoylputrescine amidase
MALAGADLLIYPTAIGWDPADTEAEQGRQRDAWITVQRGHSVANGLPLLAVNRVGFEPSPSQPEAGIRFWGSSFAAGPQGEILAAASQDREEVLLVEIDMARSEQVRRIWPFLRDRRIDAYGDLLKRYRD